MKVSSNVRETFFPSSSFPHTPASKQSCSGSNRWAGARTLRKGTFPIYCWAVIPKDRGESLMHFSSVLPLIGLCPGTMLRSGVIRGKPWGTGKGCQGRKALESDLWSCELLCSPLSCICIDLILIRTPETLRTVLTNRQLLRWQHEHLVGHRWNWFKSTAKALKTELTLKPKQVEGKLGLVVWIWPGERLAKNNKTNVFCRI